MIIIQLAGGLGNQMFGYALYLQLKRLGRQVKIDIQTKYQKTDARPVQLREVFGISYDTASREEIIAITDGSMAIRDRVRRKLTGRKSLSYVEKDKRFDANVLTLEDAYLEGYWQSEKYFKSIEKQVRDAFRFRNLKLSVQMQRYLWEMQQGQSVSLHIRRGDYLEAEATFGGICTPAYYERAIARMRERHPDCHFFVFSNDIAWCKEQLTGKEFTIVEGNDEATGYVDMYLMSRCRHHICANSSFSWWGAWLGDAPDKEVLAPQQWLNGWDCRDIYTEDMEKIPI